MSKFSQRDLFDSRRARDRGMAATTETNPTFAEQVRYEIAWIPVGSDVTGEDIRAMCADRSITPSHPNAWGAVINSAVRSGMLVATGEHRQMRAVKSHARQTPVYRRMG